MVTDGVGSNVVGVTPHLTGTGREVNIRTSLEQNFTCWEMENYRN